jgi:hypothetical protein
MPGLPKKVTIEIKDPETGVVLWRHDNVPAEVLMQIAASVQQTKAVIGATTKVASDLQSAFAGLRAIMGKAKR